jgi:rhodanese-related sulfurtransferase
MIRQLTPRQLQERLGQGGEPPVILDVREPWEHQLCALPGAVHIPMGQVPMRAAELGKDSEIVVLCHHGVRSQRVAYYLESLGFDKLGNLAGGIDAWAKDVDPTMAKY